MNLFEFLRNMKLSAKPVIVILGFSLLMTIVVIVVNRSVQSLILQAGRQQVKQEAEVVQKHFAEAEQTILVKARLLAYTPGLIEAVAGRDVGKIRTDLLLGATWFNFDDIDIADTTGSHLLDVDKVAGIQEDTLLSLALQGLETTGVVIEKDDGEPTFRLAAVIPLRDQSGEIIGGLIFSREIHEAFLKEINLSRENIELVLIHKEHIWSSIKEESHQRSLQMVEAVLLDQDTINQALNGQTIIANDLVSVNGIPHTMAHMPLTVRGQPEAVIAILANQESLVTFQNQLTTNTTLTILLLGLVALVVVTFFARQTIIIPLFKLQKVAQQMANGDYSQRVEITTKDEIGQLAQAFNKVVSLVQQREMYLEAVNQELQQEIIERKQAEKALEKFDFLQQVIDINPHLIFAKDRQGRFTLANKAFAKAYGTTVEELLGKTDADFNPDQDLAERYRQDDLAVMDSRRELFIPEECIVNTRGQALWRQSIKRPIMDEDGVARQVLGVVTDITDLKQAEQELQLTQFSIDNAADAIFWIGPEAQFLYVNKAACRLLGYSQEELLMMTLHDIDPNYPPEVWPSHWKKTQHGPVTVESRHRSKNGKIFPVEVTFTYLEFGDRVYNFVFARDITIRRWAVEALEESEERFRQVVSSISDHIYMTELAKDGKWTNRYISPNRESLTGYPPEKFKDDWGFWSTIIHPDDRAATAAQVERFVKSQNSEVEYRLIRADGDIVWVRDSGRVKKDAVSQNIIVYGVVSDITERKRVENNLEESVRLIERAKREWEASVDSLPQLICLLDHQGRIVRVNRSVERWGLATVTEVKGRELPELLHSHSNTPTRYLESRWSQAWEELVQGRSIEYEFEDNELGRHLYFQAQPISTQTMEMHRVEASSFVVVVVHDITARKQAEIALQESEERLRHVFSSISDHIYMSEITKVGQHINRYLSPVEALTGYPLEKLLADWSFWPSKIVHPDDRTIATTQAERFARGQNSEVEYRLIRADGNIVWVRDNGRVEKEPTTQSILVYGVVSDITERRQAEEALRESETTFRAVTTSAQDAIIMMDNDGNISLWNEAAERIFGHTQEEALGQDLHRLIVPSMHYDTFKKGFSSFKETGQGSVIGKTLEVSAIRKDGTEFPVEIALSSVQVQGKWQAIGIIRDITIRKRAEEALALARDQALEASRLKSQLLANVSHDLRTPLNAILGHTEMLQKGIHGPLLDKQHNVTQRIIRNTTDLTGMVNKLMDQAQLEAGTLRLVITSFTPTDLIEHMHSTMTVLAEAKGLQLTSNIAAGVPPVLSGDLDRLHQILFNLVGNAIKFTEQGSVQVRLYRPDETHWALQVSDTGSGIPAEAQSYIFDAFRQVDGTATRKHRGSGLGLSIVKQLTTMMGGEIKLESKIEQGSAFTVLLPLTQTQELS